MPPPPGCPDWAYPGMLLFTHREGERYIIHAVGLDAEGGLRFNVQRIQILPNGEPGIDNSRDQWFDEGALAHNFQPIGYFDRISPYPRFRRQPEIRQTSLSDAVRMFGNVIGGIGQVFQPLSDVPKEPPPRTAFERILEDEDD